MCPQGAGIHPASKQCSIDVMPSPGYNRAFSGRIRDAGSLALPIALGILSASGQLEPAYIEDKLFFGSLDFGGNVTSCRGTIAVESLCQELSLQGIVSAATPRGIRPYQSSLQSLDSISTDALNNPEKLIGRTMPAEPEQLSPVYPPAAVSAVAEALATHRPSSSRRIARSARVRRSGRSSVSVRATRRHS